MLQFDEEKQNKKVRDLRREEEEAYVRSVAAVQNLEYVELNRVQISLDALRLVREEDARKANLIVFDVRNKSLSIAVSPDENEHTKSIFEDLTNRGFTIVRFLTSNSSLENAYKSYLDLSFAVEAKAGSVEISNETIIELLSVLKTVQDIGNRISSILAEKKSYTISRVIEVILAGALAVNASDVHIEPEQEGAVMRYRLDGVLNIILHFNHETYNLIINRLKLLSGLRINVRNVPQDGRFSVVIKDNNIDLRVSTLPGSYGESVVMRVLNSHSVLASVGELGIEPKLLAALEEEIKRPNGMILTTGPTGSGKTTTLYAFLRQIYSPEMKIITIENPVEYRLPGIVQSQIDAERGFTFIHGLRAAVRQDPDIIMVGEIRDEETAQTAIDAALTGHLVFSTLHTNNAAGAYTRLIDLRVNPKIITSALTVSIGQRLARRLCDKCKKETAPSEKDKALMETILSSIKDREHPTVVDHVWTAPGCPECSGTGFRGRIGIYEAILSTAAIEAIVISNPSEREIRKAAEGQGILTLKQDGVMKILEGVTSVDEVNRVVDLSSIN